jgi:hypothetical protein
MTVDESATADLGVQITVVFVTFIATVKLRDPTEGRFLESPP